MNDVNRLKWPALLGGIAFFCVLTLLPKTSRTAEIRLFSQTAADPLSIFDGRSPGARMGGALFTTKPDRTIPASPKTLDAESPSERVLSLIRTPMPVSAPQPESASTAPVEQSLPADVLTKPASAAPASKPSFADELVSIANQLPANSSPDAYEAQYAALADRLGSSCTDVLNAKFTTGKVPRAALVGLARLKRVSSVCSGTGAIGGGSNAVAQVPGFSVGGGSDYTP